MYCGNFLGLTSTMTADIFATNSLNIIDSKYLMQNYVSNSFRIWAILWLCVMKNQWTDKVIINIK